jgi:hypothetical protein
VADGVLLMALLAVSTLVSKSLEKDLDLPVLLQQA